MKTINPTLTKIHILAALADGELNRYALAQRAEEDAIGYMVITERSVYYSIPSLLHAQLIEPGDLSGSYKLTSHGRTMLRHYAYHLERLACAVRGRAVEA